jgi:hypothetical protein
MNGRRELQEVVIEFFMDWYDGPLSGIAGCEGRRTGARLKACSIRTRECASSFSIH